MVSQRYLYLFIYLLLVYAPTGRKVEGPPVALTGPLQDLYHYLQEQDEDRGADTLQGQLVSYFIAIPALCRMPVLMGLVVMVGLFRVQPIGPRTSGTACTRDREPCLSTQP